MSIALKQKYLSLFFITDLSLRDKSVLISSLGGIQNVLEGSMDYFKGDKSKLELLRNKAKSTAIQRLVDLEISFCQANGVRILCFEEEDYPQRLKICYDPPIILFIRTKTEVDWNDKFLSIVGTRRSTLYGELVCRELLDAAAVFRPIIVSGFARGIDLCAHKSSLDFGLKTVAVVASDITAPYPKQNHKYIDEILEHGAFLSESSYRTSLKKFHFVQRNRLIAALSPATVVIESASSGGSLITANLALSYGRLVYAVPGRLGDQYSRGCLDLIRKNQAQLYRDIEQISQDLFWPNPEDKERILSDDLMELLSCFKLHSPIYLQDILQKTQSTVTKIQGQLTALEIHGLIRSNGQGGYNLK